jgi:hypothetical protein
VRGLQTVSGVGGGEFSGLDDEGEKSGGETEEEARIAETLGNGHWKNNRAFSGFGEGSVGVCHPCWLSFLCGPWRRGSGVVKNELTLCRIPCDNPHTRTG